MKLKESWFVYEQRMHDTQGIRHKVKIVDESNPW